MNTNLLCTLSAAALFGAVAFSQARAQGAASGGTSPRPVSQYMAVAWDDKGYLVTENWGQSWRIVSEDALEELPPRLVALLKANRAGRETAQATVIPNPTTGSTSLRFTLDRPGTVQIMIHDTRGGEVMRLPLDLAAGYHMQKIDLSSLPSGAYYYRIVNDGGSIGSGAVTVAR